MVFFKNYFMDPLKRQIFRDAFAQIFSLILRPCHIRTPRPNLHHSDEDDNGIRSEVGRLPAAKPLAERREKEDPRTDTVVCARS